MKKSPIAFLLIFAFLIPLNATAAVKAGASCTKLGSTSTYAGKKYTCVKSGKKLVWNKGVAATKPTPVVTPSSTPTVQSTPPPTPAPTKTLDPKYPRQGDTCVVNTGDVVGYDSNNRLVIMFCNEWDSRYFPRQGADPVDQTTGRILLGPLGSMLSLIHI